MEIFSQLRAIAAVGRGGVIGKNGKIPWHIAEDLRLFRRLTMGHTLIMGRVTRDSIGKPLDGRRIWVLSRSLPTADHVFPDGDSLLAAIRRAGPGELFWVCGGAEIYRLLVPHCSEVVLTEVAGPVDGDRQWTIPEEFFRCECVLRGENFTTHVWRRRPLP
jgi:dihydrofolate reductase